WKCLLKKYNNDNVVNYLQWLYANKESWAKTFVLKLFIVRISSTSWIESYNAKVNRLIFNSNTTILELSEKLMTCIFEKDKKTKYTLFHALVPKAVLTAIANTILPNICQIIFKYLT
ncbi:8834_t:CDS:1, partial [Racocetra fulgida]